MGLRFGWKVIPSFDADLGGRAWQRLGKIEPDKATSVYGMNVRKARRPAMICKTLKEKVMQSCLVDFRRELGKSEQLFDFAGKRDALPPRPQIKRFDAKSIPGSEK